MSRQHVPATAPDAPATPTEPPLLLTVEQTADLLQIGRTHAWRLVNAGVIPCVRLSPRIVRVPRQALEALIAAGGVQRTTADQNEPVPLKLRA
jgi:excisionase family DNA binding protein